MQGFEQKSPDLQLFAVMPLTLFRWRYRCIILLWLTPDDLTQRRGSHHLERVEKHVFNISCSPE